MAYRSSSRSLVGYIICSATAMTMMAMTFVIQSSTPSAFDWPAYPFKISLTVEQHVSDVLASFDNIAIAPRPADIVAPERMGSAADTLFESHRQPGQQWRIAATIYQHIDPGRRVI